MTDRDVSRRWVCFDVGETLVDETRAWATWADELRVPALTFFSVLGAVIARGGDHREVLERFGGRDWRRRAERVEAGYGGFREEDLYPDARPSLAALRAAGYGVAIAANQPLSRSAELRALGLDAQVIVMSEELDAQKPSPEFFTRVLCLLAAEPGDVSPSRYVRDTGTGRGVRRDRG